MNIIWLTPEVPYPPIGGRNGVYNRIVQLGKYNQIHLFSIMYDENERKSESELLKHCRSVSLYNRNRHKLKTYFKSLFEPYSVASRTIPSLKKDIKKLIELEKIDLIIIDFPNMVKNVIHLKKTGIIFTLNQHNIEYKRMREMKQVKSLPFYKRIAYYLESIRLKHYERRIYKKNKFDSITFFSEDDLKFFRERWKKCSADLKLFPLGANAQKLSHGLNGSHNLLFVGRLDNIAVPNVEAVLWFTDKVFPLILHKIPDTKFIIAGANPSKEVMNLSSSNVEVIPNYESLEAVYGLTDCVILPLLSGGGVKGKLLEAVAFKKIVVTTNHGVEGTKFMDADHVMVANDAEAFAEKCIDILTDVDGYADMADRAYDLFHKYYDWEKIGKDYNNYLNGRVESAQ